MAYAKAVLKCMLGETVSGVIPRELLPVDRVMQRYWVANGDGLPTDRWDDNPRQSRPPPLDDDSATVVDRVYIKLPPKTKKVIKGWYNSPLPTRTLAETFGMSERGLETAIKLALNFTQHKILATRHITLLHLLRVRV